MQFFCHYCGKARPDEDLTKEHVLPQALGGNVTPTNPFTLDVCRRCNSACGRHVDGPYIRSWLTQMDRFANGRRYIDLERDPVVPLLYMGENQDLQWEGKICDYWQGPAGDHVFHFHARYPDTESVRPEVGRPLNAKAADIDPGFIVIFAVATNPLWARCLVRSVMAQIDDAPIFVANASHPPPPGSHPRFGSITESLRPLIDRLKQVMRGELINEIALRPDAGERFLAKLALGFGSLLLDPSFRTSEDATKLRNYLWEKKADEREALKLHGTGFFANRIESNRSLNDVIGWKAGHVILLQAFGMEALGLSVMFYGSQEANIRVTANPDHWDGRMAGTGTPQTTLYLVAPGFRTFVGPVPLSKYIAASTELKRGNVVNEVGRFMHQVESHPEPPPFDLEPSA